MKKRNLKTWVKVVLLLIAFMFICFLIKRRMDTLKELSSQCDSVKGYTCTYYEIKKIYAPSQK